MSKTGEIKKLTNLIKPHIGVITNIGEAHIENFKNIYGIAKAKSEIIQSIIPCGVIILNRDDKFFNFLFHFVTPLVFSKVLRAPIPSKDITSGIRVPISNCGMFTTSY